MQCARELFATTTGMPRSSSLSLAQTAIFAHFGQARQKIYTRRELEAILARERKRWNLVKSTSADHFIEFLLGTRCLQKCAFRAEAPHDRTITRYVWGTVSPYRLALSLKSNGYLSHGTATHLHNLLTSKDRMIYVNVEQSDKSGHANDLTQDAINRGFAGKQRRSKNVFRYGSVSVTLLSGKHTKNFGVEPLRLDDGDVVNVTTTERTLIDIVVRPAYAGGIHNVLKCYNAARDQVSVPNLIQTLDRLDYVYPYHQSIGFLMQAAGFNLADCAELAARPRDHDFYLDYQMREPAFSADWRLYYPRNFKSKRV